MDLAEGVETLAVDATLDAALARGELENVEDELFRFSRIVAGSPELSLILSDPATPRQGKIDLVNQLVSQRVTTATALLLRNVLTGSHVGNAESAIERLSEVASRRRGQDVAHVTTAVALTAAQERRLADVLGRIYGRQIGLQVTVDPGVLGGLIVRVGDEVIDGSVAHRLEAASRRLAG
jgi:F-type H+-transporting ATPase subunit delta